MFTQILFFVANTIQMSAVLALTFESVSEDMRGAVFGIIQVTRAVATILVSLLVGFLVDRFGNYQLVYYASILIASGGVVASWLLRPAAKPPQGPVNEGVTLAAASDMTSYPPV